MRWGRKDKGDAKPGELTAFIDEGSQIDGKYTFTGTGLDLGAFG